MQSLEIPEAAATADFRRFFLATAVSKAGAQLSQLAVPLTAVLTLDATPAQVGLLGALATVSFLAVGLPAGAWLDRVSRRPVMIAADVARGLLLASVPLAWAADLLTLTQLYVVVLLSGLGTVFFDIAAQSLLPELVPTRRLVAANAQLATVDSAGHIGGRAGAGVLAQALGAPVVLVLTSLGYLWSAAWLWTLRHPETRPATGGRRRLWADVGAGLTFVGRHRTVRALLVAGALTNVGTSMCLVMLPLVLVRAGSGGATVGAYLAAGGVGSLVGAACARPVSRRLGEGRSLWVLGACVAPAATAIPLSGTVVPLWLGALGWLVVCLKVGYDNVLLVSFRQHVTPAPLLGRVNATVRVVLTGAVTVGSGLAGAVGQLASPRAALWVAACVLATVWLPLLASPLRGARTLAEGDGPPGRPVR